MIYYSSDLERKKNIKDLLDKFVRDDINPDELDFLYQSLNHDMHNEEVNAWLYRNWDESSRISKKNRSEALYESILQKIDTSALPFPIQRKYRPHLTVTILKFAAVFIIGFSIAVLLQRLLSGWHETPVQEISYNQVHIPLGSKSSIKLSDGTQVWLNSGSTLKYPGVFASHERIVFLEGEAYFDVQPDDKCPFRVNTPEINITVLGTTFNVKSYPDESIVETTLVSGSLEIETKKAGSRKKSQLRLSPNQKATFTKSSNSISLQEMPLAEKNKPVDVKTINIEQKVNTEIITSWKDNKLVFSRERFEDIAIKLERWYNVQIILEDEDVKDYRFTGTFDKETLEQALNALKIASPFEFSIDKNTILIYSKSPGPEKNKIHNKL